MDRTENRMLEWLGRAFLTLTRPLGRAARARAWAALPYVQNPALVPPPEGPALVLAPHPDDEAIGCAGAILLHPRRAEQISVAILTGADYGPAAAHPRHGEMQAGAAELGVGQIHYLPGRDGRLAEEPELAAALAGLLEQLRPAHVFLPFFMDAHHDHRAANVLFLDAAARAGLDPATQVWAYEVWSPCPANAAVDISAVAEAKRRAIGAHVSQDAAMGYAEAMLGLNRYRALQVNWKGDPALTHAEAFLRLPLAEYAALARPWLARSGGVPPVVS